MKIGDKVRVKNPLWDTKLQRVSEESGKQGFIIDTLSDGDVVVQIENDCKYVFHQNQLLVLHEY
jgi:hypothetical protein